MSAAGWLHPEWLPGLAAAWLAVAAALAAGRLRARRRARRLGVGGRGEGLAREALLLAALLAVAVALAGPRIGTRTERLSTSGVDVAILVDVSRSMDARDLPPSRLDRARRAASALLAGLAPGDRAALAVFAARGVLLTPLTPDTAALDALLPALDTSLVQPAASRLGAGLREALDVFDAGSERPRVLVVLSDGEDPDGAGDLALAELRRAGVRVVAVALASEAGATIPSHGRELRDGAGRIVTTRLDAARLARLAEATGGALLRPDAFGAVDATALREAVRRDAPPPGAGGTVERRVPAIRVAPFALVALLLLALEAGRGAREPAKARPGAGAAGPRARSVRATGGRRAPAAAAALLALLALGATDAGPHDARALLGRGLAHARAEDWAEAERSFRAAALAAHDARLASDAYHDAGVAALRAGRLEAARDAFFESLAAAPTLETRFNLEWTLRALAAEPPPPAGSAPESRDEAGRPEPEPDARDAPPLDARASAGEGETAAPRPEPPPLAPEEAERWLERTGDDPGRALRAHRGDDAPPTRASAW